MYMRRVTVALACDASGDQTVYSPAVSGRIMSVIYTKTDFANGVDITVTTRTTGVPVIAWTDVNASIAVHPRHVVHGLTGTALAGVEPANAADEELKIVVAQGGVSKTGTLTFVIG